MKLYKLLSTISALLFLSCSTQAFSMSETCNLDHGKASKHSSLRSETEHKTEVTIVNDTQEIIYYDEYMFTGYDGNDFFIKRAIWYGDGLLVYSDEKVYDSVPIVLYYHDRRTVSFNDVVPNHGIIKASTYFKK